MNFVPGEDAEQLRAVVREFLAKRSDEASVRAQMQTESGYDPTVWCQSAEELGLPGLAVPERFGGSGAGAVELGVVFEEMGAALFCAPFLSTVGLAVTALLELGDEDAAARYLPGIVAGNTIAALAWLGSSPAVSALTARRDGDRWSVWGTADVVVDGCAADLVLVAAHSHSGCCLFAVAGDAAGMVRSPLVAMDSTRKLACVHFDACPAVLLGSDGGAGDALRRTADLAALYLAAEQLGGAARVLEMAVGHARTRYQFGRPIGSFGPIKHRCADMLVDVESARSVVYHGLWTAVHDPDNLALSASLARAVCSDAYTRLSAHNIQILGGIGFTWEHPAHLYLKRAKSSALLLGSATTHRARLAEVVATSCPPVPSAAQAGDDRPDAAAPIDAVIDDFLRDHPVGPPDDAAADRALREARFDAGLAVLHFAEGCGGRALDAGLQAHVDRRFAAAGCPDHMASNVIGLGMAMPTIHAHGTSEQKRRYLRSCFSGADIWCQLFSEPGAGSDLAALATRAVRDGDVFVVNGQKIWTSLAHVARFGLLLARTDPDVPKHKGLTYFLLDMRSAGVQVRPLRQLTGEAEFNEVYLTDVRIPVADVLGEVGQGWAVAMTTLANERISIGARPAQRGEGPIGRAVEIYCEAAAAGLTNAAVTERLMLLWTQAEAARLTNIRAAQAGRGPGPEGSIAKLQMAELNKAIYELCVDMSGTAGLLIDGYDEHAPTASAAYGGADVRKSYLRSLANSIEGGTSEVMRNILGERVLGLPGEPRVDRDIPWREVRRS
ncbi:acyl-CoA dehydrogenase [Mycobacterium triplex]|uniref:Acyl-CoA dehydrogenase n=1 Tax=Mycobacterium triplex TaxID=47839 RepID=A0A024K3T5_9MYCO|nr:acyl-CoA dehydrogenase [Mycobacterium triplex]ORX00212.1 acyl-CoA dehydrogenase [Mycobacterium triplex]CDO90163.1 acyl-CoA dehydrogenase [Mycobacterium triplex]